jgi:DGQHR domain-containing protein
MLATRIRQKDGVFYFVAYKASDLLDRVKFTSRYYFEGEEIKAEGTGDDDVAAFIAGIEKSERGFQRLLNRLKVKQIVNFFETASSQPVIPGTILLFTDERLRFDPTGSSGATGYLADPKGKFLIIDGQHRLAGLQFYTGKHPEQADKIEVPCIVFDGATADFATEMFVIINSTHTKINKSHLVDLYEKVSWASPEKKFAANLVNQLYGADDSPLQYRINRLGGRSRQEKWILQSELFNELHKAVQHHETLFRERFQMRGDRAYPIVRDYFKAVREVMEPIWGKNDKFMFTRDVTLKALIRVLDDLLYHRALINEWEKEKTPAPFLQLLKGWAEFTKEFRAEGFYERFPAKGQVERVRRIHMKLTEAVPAVVALKNRK